MEANESPLVSDLRNKIVELEAFIVELREQLRQKNVKKTSSYSSMSPFLWVVYQKDSNSVLTH